jgi:hypothetical protein
MRGTVRFVCRFTRGVMTCFRRVVMRLDGDLASLLVLGTKALLERDTRPLALVRGAVLPLTALCDGVLPLATDRARAVSVFCATASEIGIARLKIKAQASVARRERMRTPKSMTTSSNHATADARRTGHEGQDIDLDQLTDARPDVVLFPRKSSQCDKKELR